MRSVSKEGRGVGAVSAATRAGSQEGAAKGSPRKAPKSLSIDGGAEESKGFRVGELDLHESVRLLNIQVALSSGFLKQWSAIEVAKKVKSFEASLGPEVISGDVEAIAALAASDLESVRAAGRDLEHFSAGITRFAEAIREYRGSEAALSLSGLMRLQSGVEMLGVLPEGSSPPSGVDAQYNEFWEILRDFGELWRALDDLPHITTAGLSEEDLRSRCRELVVDLQPLAEVGIIPIQETLDHIERLAGEEGQERSEAAARIGGVAESEREDVEEPQPPAERPSTTPPEDIEQERRETPTKEASAADKEGVEREESRPQTNEAVMAEVAADDHSVVLAPDGDGSLTEEWLAFAAGFSTDGESFGVHVESVERLVQDAKSPLEALDRLETYGESIAGMAEVDPAAGAREMVERFAQCSPEGAALCRQASLEALAQVVRFGPGEEGFKVLGEVAKFSEASVVRSLAEAMAVGSSQRRGNSRRGKEEGDVLKLVVRVARLITSSAEMKGATGAVEKALLSGIQGLVRTGRTGESTEGKEVLKSAMGVSAGLAAAIAAPPKALAMGGLSAVKLGLEFTKGAAVAGALTQREIDR